MPQAQQQRPACSIGSSALHFGSDSPATLIFDASRGTAHTGASAATFTVKSEPQEPTVDTAPTTRHRGSCGRYCKAAGAASACGGNIRSAERQPAKKRSSLSSAYTSSSAWPIVCSRPSLLPSPGYVSRLYAFSLYSFLIWSTYIS